MEETIHIHCLKFCRFCCSYKSKVIFKKVVALKTATQFNDTSNYARRKRKKNWYLRMNMREGTYMHRKKNKLTFLLSLGP